MLKMSDDEHASGEANKDSLIPSSPTQTEPRVRPRAMAWLKNLVRGKASNSNEQLQEALEEYIEELKESDLDDESADNQKELITNVLNTRDLRVADVMIPRANIVAIEQNASMDDLKRLFAERQFSRLPVYADSLDHVIGWLHIKDILNCLLENRPCVLSEMIREAMIVYPGLPIMDLFKMMREDKKHMALVVDEHGGIDGLVTMNDVIEAIVGDMHDEFEHDEPVKYSERPDGSITADARMEMDEFEERYGRFLSPDEREDIETLGGLAFHIAGHVPKRGEILKHPSGVTLDILDADQSKVNRVRVRNLPQLDTSDEV
jgi:CBS domain containing-hemolysin-like protein